MEPQIVLTPRVIDILTRSKQKIKPMLVAHETDFNVDDDGNSVSRFLVGYEELHVISAKGRDTTVVATKGEYLSGTWRVAQTNGDESVEEERE